VSEVVSILRDLVRIQSDRNESGIVRYLAARFKSSGIPYVLQEVAGAGRDNIIATWGTGEPSLAFNSHSDTVEIGETGDWKHDPFGGDVIDGYMYGRGTADAKGSLASMVVAFESAIQSIDPSAGRLVLMAVASEETMGLGTEKSISEGLRTQAAIVGEPTGLEVCVAHKGVLRMNITVHGKAAHASEPWEGRNAILDMQQVIAGLQKLSERVSRRSDPLLGKSTLAITMIQGGIARNVIPQRCTISIDRRILPSEGADDVRGEIDEVLESLSKDIRITYEPVSLAEAARTEPEEGIVEMALNARDAELGSPSQASGFTACCDMWHLKNRGGIPTIILGPGELSQAHKTDEHVAVSDLNAAVEIYRRIALDWLSNGI
jgi:succinyl-diaminopimelate desuccinylase